MPPAWRGEGVVSGSHLPPPGQSTRKECCPRTDSWRSSDPCLSLPSYVVMEQEQQHVRGWRWRRPVHTLFGFFECFFHPLLQLQLPAAPSPFDLPLSTAIKSNPSLASCRKRIPSTIAATGSTALPKLVQTDEQGSHVRKTTPISSSMNP